MDLYLGSCSLCKFLVDNDDLQRLDSRRDLISLIIMIAPRDNVPAMYLHGTGTGTGTGTLINWRVYCEIIA